MKEMSCLLGKHLREVYDCNPFVTLLQMQIGDMQEGEVKLSMPVPHQVTNLYGAIHGGALASLADTAMGMSCATLDKRVVTLDMNINFIRSGQEGELMQAKANVAHNGRQTMVVECEITNQESQLLVKARGTFFVVGKFEPEPD